MAVPKVLLAYFAGIIDGEGHIGLAKFYRKDVRNDVWAIVQISFADSYETTKLLESFKEYFGGYIIHYSTSNLRSRPIVFWRITSQKACLMAETILPYLRIKKRQAEIIITYQKYVADTSWRKGQGKKHYLPDVRLRYRQTLLDEMKKLNKRGVDITK